MDKKIAFVYCNKMFYITINGGVVTVFCADGSVYSKYYLDIIEKDSHDPFRQLVMAVCDTLF